ncbi:MAG: DUF4258 domain-containing protein [Oligoflexia bacterium]|nr:DUF4258 domain-containing protein [Oligoflexia bacterium]
MDEPLTQVKARQLIQEILREGTWSFTRHARQRTEERDLDLSDCVNMLRCGFVEEIDFTNGSWRYRVCTPRIGVVVAFNGEKRLVIVTTFRRKP